MLCIEFEKERAPPTPGFRINRLLSQVEIWQWVSLLTIFPKGLMSVTRQKSLKRVETIASHSQRGVKEWCKLKQSVLLCHFDIDLCSVLAHIHSHPQTHLQTPRQTHVHMWNWLSVINKSAPLSSRLFHKVNGEQCYSSQDQLIRQRLAGKVSVVCSAKVMEPTQASDEKSSVSTVQERKCEM